MSPIRVHMQGYLRRGLEKEEVKLLCQITELVARWAGKKLDPVKRFDEL